MTPAPYHEAFVKTVGQGVFDTCRSALIRS
jgi:hypothetical protein